MNNSLKNHNFEWPAKLDLLGVGISKVTPSQQVKLIIEAAEKQIPALIAHLPVHGLISALRDSSHGHRLNNFDIVAPDGQPVRWALNFLYKIKLKHRVYGPEQMLMICKSAAEKNLGVYLYGSTPRVLKNLRTTLTQKFPTLKIVGCESPPFRPLTPNERKSMISRINNTGAHLLFIGLGNPKQENFAYEHKNDIKPVQITVGAAFDFNSHNKKMAPTWMQACGLEWLFRLSQEPTRLWRRYLISNILFLVAFLLQLFRLKRF